MCWLADGCTASSDEKERFGFDPDKLIFRPISNEKQ